MNNKVEWIRREATDSQIQAILDHRDKLLALFNDVFDENMRANLKEAKKVGISRVTCSIRIDLLKDLIIDLP